jgi:drug/metabolite transporter (DMT)-like permease
MGDGFQPFYQAWVRSLIVILLMLPFMLARRTFRRIDREDWPRVGVYALFCIFTQVPFYYAFNHAPIGTAQLIFYSMFIVTTYIAGRFYLGESVTKIKIVAVVITFLGMVTVFGASVFTFAPLGLALAALTGVASGGELSSSKKISEKYSPTLLAFWGWVFTLATHLPISVLLGEAQHAPSLNGPWLWMLCFSAVSAGAFWLSIVGFKYVDASIGSLIGTTEVLFSVLFGAFVFHQTLSWSVAGGGTMIVLASMLPSLLDIHRARVASALSEPVTAEEPVGVGAR